jgi:hypothetical protein
VASEYEALAKDLLFWVMGHNFNTGDPKGVFCCPACTVSLLPLYALGCFRWVDWNELESAVVDAMVRAVSQYSAAIIQRSMLNGLRDLSRLDLTSGS